MTLEQNEQRDSALRLRRRADILAMGVAKYIDMDMPTAEDMADLGNVLLEASKMANDAEEVLGAVLRILDSQEDLAGASVPN